MKKIIITLSMALFFVQAMAQTTSKELGLWQAKLNGVNLKAKDLGYTDPQYANYLLYYVFGKGNKAYLAVSDSKAKVTAAGMPALIKKQFASEGTYKVYDNLESMPADLKAKFDQYGPYDAGLKFIEAAIMGEPMSFILNPTKRTIRGMNKEVNLELIYLGAY